LLGLAGGGVYPASAVTGAAVRSYRPASLNKAELRRILRSSMSEGGHHFTIAQHLL